MTLDELAERLGIHKRTVMRRVDRGEIPKPRIREGRIIEWANVPIERWLNSRRRKVGRPK